MGIKAKKLSTVFAFSDIVAAKPANEGGFAIASLSMSRGVVFSWFKTRQDLLRNVMARIWINDLRKPTEDGQRHAVDVHVMTIDHNN